MGKRGGKWGRGGGQVHPPPPQQAGGGHGKVDIIDSIHFIEVKYSTPRIVKLETMVHKRGNELTFTDVQHRKQRKKRSTEYTAG